MGDLRNAERKWDFMLDHDQKIGYIRLTQFGNRAVDEMKAALEQLKQRGARALVLDLRGNPGGQLTAAVEISNLFLAAGRIVSVEGRNRPQEIYDAKPETLITLGSADYPIAVLIDSGSASASEIVAAALQDAKRAVMVGERTFGKGSVQNLIQLEGGNSAVKVTTAKYIRPSGKNIHRFPMKSKETDDWGVRPDIEVKLTPRQEVEQFLARRDRDIVRVEPSAEERAESASSPRSPNPLPRTGRRRQSSSPRSRSAAALPFSRLLPFSRASPAERSRAKRRRGGSTSPSPPS